MVKILEFNVRNQSLSRIDFFRPAEKSVGYLKATFHFITEEWSGGTLKLRARAQGESTVHEANIIDGVALVPWEAVQKNGFFFISVYARNGDVEITTNYVEVSLNATLPGGSETRPPTPTDLDLLRKEVEELREEIENINPGSGGGNVKITINGESPDENGNFIINALNDVEIAQLDAALIGGTNE